MVPVPPPRIGLDGEIRTPNLRLPTPARGQVALRPGGTDGGSRTRTDGVLSAVPLPVGLRQRGPCGIRTRTLLLAGELRFQLRHRPWLRERESNPPREAYETSLIARFPAVGRPTGLEPASSGATSRRLDRFRPRSPSTREDSNLRHPPCRGGGLPLTYSSARRASWSRTTSSRGIGAVPPRSGSRPAQFRGPGSARIFSGRFEPAAPPSELQDRAPTRGPGDPKCARCGRYLADEGTPGLVEWVEPAAGIEPASSRVRAERPCLPDLAGSGCGRLESNPLLRRGMPTCVR